MVLSITSLRGPWWLLDNFLPGKTNSLPTLSPKALHSRNCMLLTLFYSLTKLVIIGFLHVAESSANTTTRDDVSIVLPLSFWMRLCRLLDPQIYLTLSKVPTSVRPTWNSWYILWRKILAYISVSAMDEILRWGRSLHIVHEVRSASPAKTTAVLSPVF